MFNKLGLFGVVFLCVIQFDSSGCHPEGEKIGHPVYIFPNSGLDPFKNLRGQDDIKTPTTTTPAPPPQFGLKEEGEIDSTFTTMRNVRHTNNNNYHRENVIPTTQPPTPLQSSTPHPPSFTTLVDPVTETTTTSSTASPKLPSQPPSYRPPISEYNRDYRDLNNYKQAIEDKTITTGGSSQQSQSSSSPPQLPPQPVPPPNPMLVDPVAAYNYAIKTNSAFSNRILSSQFNIKKQKPINFSLPPPPPPTPTTTGGGFFRRNMDLNEICRKYPNRIACRYQRKQFGGPIIRGGFPTPYRRPSVVRKINRKTKY